MSEFQFSCPSCRKLIQVDEAFHGQQITCPICNNKVLVPNPAPNRLSVKTVDPSTHVPVTIQRADFRPPPPKKSPLPAILKTVIPLLILGGLAYFVMHNPDLKSRFLRLIGKESEEAPAAAAPAATGDTAATAQAPAAPAAPPVPKVPPPVWALDLKTAEIPWTSPTGMVAAVPFVADTVVLEPNFGLVFRHGTNANSDRELVVYLKLRPGEKIEGHTWNVSTNDRANIPQLAKRWKPRPGYAQSKTYYSSGYALKLELGPNKDGQVPGRIYAVLPDAEKSYIAGIFSVATTANPAAPQQAPAEAPNTSGMDPKIKQRYGLK